MPTASALALSTVLSVSAGVWAAVGIGPAVVVGPIVGAAAWFAWGRLMPERTIRSDPIGLAACWDLLAASLRAGLAVPVAVRSVSDELSGTARAAMRKVADLLVLGADPVSAWEPALVHPDTAELARAARRTARTGSGLAAVADELAARTRTSADQAAQERSQRAAVWVTAPLGGCFLPAFLCLGIVPVLAGMVGRLAASW
ncbi:type II secretion system F family protein [Parasphingorhabdus pacifica]